jgi:hypothetical protein
MMEKSLKESDPEVAEIMVIELLKLRNSNTHKL